MASFNYLSQRKPFSSYNNNQQNDNSMNSHKSNENIDLYKIPRSKFYDIDHKGKKRVIYTTKEGRKIAVGFPSIINKQVECRCKNCMVIFPYIAIEKRKIVVCPKKSYFECFNKMHKNCQDRIITFNSLLSKHSDRLPYLNPSFLDARYSSIRCIIDKNNIVTYYCLLKKMVSPTHFTPTFTPIAHHHIPEYIKKMLYLKYLQDNAVVTLASFKKKGQNQKK